MGANEETDEVVLRLDARLPLPSPTPTTALDNGCRAPHKLLRAVVARLLGRKP
jgi:hypothetical protein